MESRAFFVCEFAEENKFLFFAVKTIRMLVKFAKGNKNTSKIQLEKNWNIYFL